MPKIALMVADGLEEIEGLTVTDVIRRAKYDIDMVSIMETKNIVSSHKICFEADKMFDEVNFDEYDAIVLPGGLGGTNNLIAHEGLAKVLLDFAAKGKLVAAICAAPSVLGGLHILEGKKATCYPGFEDKLLGATYVSQGAVTDGNVITARGMGASIDFALAIVAYFSDENTAKELGKTFMYGV